MTNLDDLEKKAREATPGPWVSDCSDESRQILDPDEYIDVSVWQGVAFGGKFINNIAFDNCIANADFIAAANPSAILDLIARCRKAEEEIERLKAVTHVSIPTNTMEQFAAREIERATAKLKARVAELESHSVEVVSPEYVIDWVERYSRFESPPPLYLRAPQAVKPGWKLLGETRENGVVWFDQNPHAFPIGTQFYAAAPSPEGE